jgi:hypothetical protein
MSKHKTSKGREFNMSAFAGERGSVTAVGNAPRNARGDLLGPGGKIVASAQEIANRFHDASMAGSTSVNLNAAHKEVGRREVIGADGVPRWEVNYADGSVEIESKPVDLDARNTSKDF